MQLDLLGNEPMMASASGPVASGSPRSASRHDISEHHEEEKAPSAFKTISEVAEQLGVPTHVLRFWESRFPQIKPTKLRGGRRYYRPEDVDTLSKIQQLLYKQGYTIKGAKKAFGQKPAEIPVKMNSVERPTAPQVQYKLSERQQSQLAVIRQELVGMRDVLKEYL